MRDLCKAIRRICPPEQQSLIITVNYAHKLALMGNLQFAKQRFLKCSQFRRRLLTLAFPGFRLHLARAHVAPSRNWLN